MDRPFGVTIIAFLNFVVAVVCLSMSVGGFNAGFVFLLASSGLGGQFGAGTFLLIGGVSLLLGLVSLALGMGLWKLRNRSRQAQIGLLALLSTFEFIVILGALMRSAILSAVFHSLILGVEVWILIYLFTPAIREAFGAAPRRVEDSSPYDS